MKEILVNTILLYVFDGFLPAEFNNYNILKTEKNSFQIRLYIPNAKITTYIMIFKNTK